MPPNRGNTIQKYVHESHSMVYARDQEPIQDWSDPAIAMIKLDRKHFIMCRNCGERLDTCSSDYLLHTLLQNPCKEA